MSLDTSPVSICSNALLELGANPINSFDEKTEIAMLCANIYPIARDSLLREHPWSFAIKRVLLAKDKEAPLFDYKNSFTLPSDCLRVLRIGEMRDQTDYVIEAMKVLSNVESLKLVYIFQNTDVATYDSASVDLLTALVAAKIAYAITQSTSMAQFKLQEYELKLKKAKTLNGMEAPNDSFGTGYGLVERRFHG